MNGTYSFLDVTCALVGPGCVVNLGNGSGSSDEGIEITPSGPINTMQVGADGLAQHSLHADVSGHVVIRVLKTSPVNQILMDAYNFQTTSSVNHGKNTMTLVDKGRGDSVTCQQVAFSKAPSLTYAKEAGTNEWEFDAGQIYRTLAA